MYYKDTQNKLHSLSATDIAAGGEKFLPAGSVAITDQEADAVRVASIPVPTADEIAAAALAAQDKANAQAVRADAKYQALIALNPVGAAAGSVKDWVVNNFPTLTQPEKNNLTTVVQALVITARKL
jgi:hypothetical protein